MNKQTENNKKSNNGSSATIIIAVLGVAFFIGSIVFVLALMGVFGGSKKNEDDTTRYELTSSVITESVSEDETTEAFASVSDAFEEDQSSNNQVGNAQKPSVSVNNQVGSASTDNKTTTSATTKNAVVEYYEQLSPKGNNMLSDNCENAYIKLISETYNVDSDLLVAVYSVPDSGDNFVLQFNGKKDGAGNYIKSPDTLEKIYQVDKSKNVKIATGKTTGNVGVSYGEGILCFNMVKTVVMEQYPDYFTGLKGK